MLLRVINHLIKKNLSYLQKLINICGFRLNYYTTNISRAYEMQTMNKVAVCFVIITRQFNPSNQR